MKKENDFTENVSFKKIIDYIENTPLDELTEELQRYGIEFEERKSFDFVSVLKSILFTLLVLAMIGLPCWLELLK